jgi:hypothetical protein
MEQTAIIAKIQAQISEMEKSIQSMQKIVNMLLKQSKGPQLVPLDPTDFSMEDDLDIFTDEGGLESI